MQLNQFYTVLCTDDVAGNAAFWQRHFRFSPAFWSDWYVHLTSEVSPSANLAILDYRHDSLPAPFQRKAAGLLVNLEVEDVDAEYAKAVAAGLKIHVTLRDEPRAGFTRAPPRRVRVLPHEWRRPGCLRRKTYGLARSRDRLPHAGGCDAAFWAAVGRDGRRNRNRLHPHGASVL